MHENVLVVIPARLGSTRLPRKMLLRETGKTLLQHTYEAVAGSDRVPQPWVAVDDAELLAEVEAFGGRAVMTGKHHQSGTDRVAEVAERFPEAEIIVNVQGDEPDLPPEAVERLLEVMHANPSAPMGTLATPLRDRAALHDPSCVKVVLDATGRALYFSRSPIPHARNWDDSLLTAEPPHFWQHLGLYAYRRDYLLWLVRQPVSQLEQLEKLEQLRALEAGAAIMVGRLEQAGRGIDTLDDYRAFVARRRAG